MAEVLTLGDLALMPAAEQQGDAAGPGVVLKPLAGEAEAPAMAALDLFVVEEGPVLGAAGVGWGAGRGSGGVAGAEWHDTGAQSVRVY